MAKNHFSRAKKGSQGVKMGVLGVVWISQSGLGILIRAPEVQFSVPPILDPRKVIFSHFVLFGDFWSFSRVGGFFFWESV